MDTETTENPIKTFYFSFPTCTNSDILFKLEVPIEIPYNGSTKELVQRVINMFHIPVYLEDELNEKIAKFVSEETKIHQNDIDKKLIDQLKNSEVSIDGVVKKWEKLFKENIFEYADQKGTSDEEVFGMAYHKLVHSPALETILQVENSYATTVADMLKNRDEDIKKLTDSQTEEMEEQVRLLNTFTTEEDINELACKQFEAQALVSGRWESQLDALWQTQRSEYRAWLMSLLDECQANNSAGTPSNSPLGTFTPAASFSPEASNPGLEESFTIHLGSQLKQSHNLRILCTDVMRLCRPNGHADSQPSPRVQRALSLYSGELSAVVLLATGPPRAGSTAALAEVARAPTEYHFPTVDVQLADICDRAKDDIDKRNEARHQEASPQPRSKPKGWQCGDVFITRHSNLQDVHLIFHLIVDDHSKTGEINSRHPVILGLRNILKIACCNDVTNISLPILLTYELTEEMTAAWCLRRAELVLKCVKGFMLEGVGWGGAALRSLQLIAPPHLAPDVSRALAALVPAVCRLANPRRLK